MNSTGSENKKAEAEEHGTDMLERLPQVSTQDDQATFGILESDLRKTLLIWLHNYPRYAVACLYASEEHYIESALDRFRQVMLRGQVVCHTPAKALIILRASLQGAILDTLRIASYPGADSISSPEKPVTQNPSNASREARHRLQNLSLTEREKRLVYLLYHCSLNPHEIVRLYPQEWSDLLEITHLCLTILKRLIYNENS